MANAHAVDLALTPTAAEAVATTEGPTEAITPWVSSLGAKDYVLHLHVDSGDIDVSLEGCNHIASNVTPDPILTASQSGAGDVYATTTDPHPHKYVRIRCTVYAAGVGVAKAVGVR